MNRFRRRLLALELKMCRKWREVQEFSEGHNPNKFLVNRAINILNVNVMFQFSENLQKRHFRKDQL